ncbi:hypothetical protein E4K08_14895 [Raoultella ornithinolytica]|nr:hypothetical protein [Raoultella ornithinolytica]OWY88271.1 hypothetical protein CAC00_08755 [Raoultella ornithinolytica]QCK77792.1 hypothetical protein E4K08_14895 [Raoultella ornithinolytica]RWT91808.1 hypothetical protein DN602_28870 [Raoultella ornithinolytica]
MTMSNLKCFEMGWAVLLDSSLWIKWLGILSNIATCVAGVIAVAAAIIAYNQLKSGRDEGRKNTAYGIYQQYLLLCINNPQFSDGMIKPVIKNSDYGQYRWFVSSMLFSFEQILDTQKNDQQWIGTIKSQLNIHKEILKVSRTVKNNEWSTELLTIIKEVVK